MPRGGGFLTNYSLEAYLKKLPTKTLELFWENYAQERFREDYSPVIDLVEQELLRRKKQESLQDKAL